ncbi:MAG: hypothetical protein HWE39_23010 [Oceanospirillaceae bacterium]|nr:hypothetical protein [Oceanospirillaceae bacterium]
MDSALMLLEVFIIVQQCQAGGTGASASFDARACGAAGSRGDTGPKKALIKTECAAGATAPAFRGRALVSFPAWSGFFIDEFYSSVNCALRVLYE